MRSLPIEIIISELSKMVTPEHNVELWKKTLLYNDSGKVSSFRIAKIFDIWNLKVVKNDSSVGYDILLNILVSKCDLKQADAEYWMTLYYFSYDYWTDKE